MTKQSKSTEPDAQGRNHGCSQVGPHPLRGVAGGGLEFRVNGVLRIEPFSGLSKWESDQKAKARINVLLGE